MPLEISNYIDLCALTDAAAPTPHAEHSTALRGAMYFGAPGAAWRESMRQAAPAGLWLCAARVEQLIGSADPRFPKDAPDVLDLCPGDEQFAAMLLAPLHAWWPLAGEGQSPRTILLHLPALGAKVPLLRKLAHHFPRTRFLLEPFAHGPQSSWMPLVRLAESDNVWLTTLGLPPGARCQWRERADAEAALHFVSGEVGAGKLFFASGNSAGESEAAMLSWLNGIAVLDEKQRQLVAVNNALELFGGEKQNSHS